HMFTTALAEQAARLGVQFSFNTGIDGLMVDGSRITGIATSAGVLRADSYVAALGSWSRQMLRGIDVAIPVYAVKGYSITVPIADEAGAP
ncbi:FAD-dependent oxidoreductase, partial [Escherichia coli]|uniref:FAD-dependent oxidoreductase n=1 Tax=Escherichia coli TaxID=562 RepID=UPI0015C46AC5